ncbi:hypothetical protein BHE74_00022558 [Ensete ventricosum]|nr:hypothetical protein BHE74_00022558 [Ensete ventricosum]
MHGLTKPFAMPFMWQRNVVGGSSSEKDGKVLDAKTLRRLAQNREAARKSRLRKKVVFDMEYSRWLEENCKKMMELRGGLQAHRQDGDLRVTVDECLALYEELFQLKAAAARSDVFHVLTGMWTTPAERCFLWMGGFRPSELLKVEL